MELGLISDVHANLPALEAVLSDMPDTVDEIVCLGDVVGYNPYPAECVELVRDRCGYVLQGNHDREVRNAETYSSNRQAEAGLQYAESELCDEQVEHLLERPEQEEIHGSLAVHSHPENTDEYVFPSDFSEVTGYLDGYDALVLGHTHLQGVERFDEGLVLNPGSVGQPRDESTAAYAVLDTETLEPELRRTEYDIWEVIKRVRKSGLPDKAGERLLPNSVGSRRSERQRRDPWS